MYISDTLRHKILTWQLNKLPPIKEMEAYRLLADTSINEDNELLAIIFSMIAYFRLKRQHQEAGVQLFLSKALELDPHLTIALELTQQLEGNKFVNQLQDYSFRDWLIHETDHESTKRKKFYSIYDNLKKLNNTLKSEQEYEIFYQETSTIKQFFESKIELFEYLDSNIQSGGKTVGLSVAKVNQLLRTLEDLKVEMRELIAFNNETVSPLDQLNQMIGLEQIKQYMHKYYHYLQYQQKRKRLGFQMLDEPGLHMIITGNPGTGKTTLARLLAKLYHELGLLDSDRVVEVNRSHLVGAYVGQSEENTMNYVKEAIGGVLFIDEAYSLKREGQSGNDYGQAVIDTLVSAMTNKEYGGKFAVILAGYPEETRQFLWSNPGLRSRFPEQNQIELPNYTSEELLEIAEYTALENDYFFTKAALKLLEQIIEKERVDDTFGNARTIKNIILKIIFNKGAKQAHQNNEKFELLTFMKISSEDLQFMDIQSSQNKSSPIQELENLIGLENIKQEVRKLSSFVTLQKKRLTEGYPAIPIQLHAVFTGNPGTGKTTVASIYADILRHCGLLKRGHLIIASRSDLVAGYVGQTSIKTKKKIREALGGVLFIDEAYSLFQNNNQDFGKEVIDTLVDEITKHNENLVVILAGYSEEMKRLIHSNPGLESRFKKFFEFPDFTPEQLTRLALYQAENYQFEIDKDAEEFLQQQFQKHVIKGNGRFVQNLIDEAIQYQAYRIEKENLSDLNVTLKNDDIKNAWQSVEERQL